MGDTLHGLPSAPVRAVARADWEQACAAYLDHHRGEGRPVDEAAHALIRLRGEQDLQATPAGLAMAGAVAQLAIPGTWETPDEEDLPPLRLAAAALEAEARGGAMSDVMRLAWWLMAAAVRAACGDLEEARALVPTPGDVAANGSMVRLGAPMCALDPALAEEIAPLLEPGTRANLTLRFMADLNALALHPGDVALEDELRATFDLLSATGGEFAEALGRALRAALCWRIPGLAER